MGSFEKSPCFQSQLLAKDANRKKLQKKNTPPLYSEVFAIEFFQPAEVQDVWALSAILGGCPLPSLRPSDLGEANQGICFFGLGGWCLPLPRQMQFWYYIKNQILVGFFNPQKGWVKGDDGRLLTKGPEKKKEKNLETNAWKLTSKTYSHLPIPMKPFGNSYRLASTNMPVHAPNNLQSHPPFCLKPPQLNNTSPDIHAHLPHVTTTFLEWG